MDQDYKRIETAISYLAENFRNHPPLDEIASRVNLSPFHFQKMFTRWAGVSPKQFIRYLTFQQSKISLKQNSTLFEASLEAGLSGTGRLHDLFVSMIGMTPGEFKKGGYNLVLNYSVAESPFGDILVISTSRGICHISFLDEEDPESVAKELYPNATLEHRSDQYQENAISFFHEERSHPNRVILHLKGTPFQVMVWEALLMIPQGELATYSEIAAKIGKPKASRAVGSAVAQNPVAYLIPCHRVIRSTGIFGEYRWGSGRKTAMIGWEAVKNAGSEG